MTSIPSIMLHDPLKLFHIGSAFRLPLGAAAEASEIRKHISNDCKCAWRFRMGLYPFGC